MGYNRWFYCFGLVWWSSAVVARERMPEQQKERERRKRREEKRASYVPQAVRRALGLGSIVKIEKKM